MSENYVFPGVQPFIDAEAEAAGLDGFHVGPTRSLWHVGRIQDALGQLPTVPEEARPGIVAHVERLRAGLALALAGVDAAIAAAKTGCGMVEAPPAAPAAATTPSSPVAPAVVTVVKGGKGKDAT